MDKNKVFDERYPTFGTAVLKLLPQLPHNKGGTHLGDQLFRSGTLVGAHLQEATAAESKADFIHKMQMALKEMREAKYWLSLILLADILSTEIISGLLQESDELVAILTRSGDCFRNLSRSA